MRKNENTQIVILGMHRSGTSLVANMIQKMGVNIGNDLLEPDKDNPGGYFEDTDFIRLNKQILSAASGAWDSPPKNSRVRAILPGFETKIKYIVDYKNNQGNKLWGWKDPRTSLIPYVYHLWLDNPYYLIVERNHSDIIKSLMKREVKPDNGNMPLDEYCQHLINVYYTRIYHFVNEIPTRTFTVDYDILTRDLWGTRDLLEQMCYKFKLEPLLIPDAMEVIKYREKI